MPLFEKLSASAALLVLALASTACAGTAVPVLRSGVYEGLALAVGHDGGVDGLFVQEQGEGVTKRCSFFLKGKVARDGSVKIDSWSASARLHGDLRATQSGVLLRLPKARDHAGCGLVLPPEADQSMELSRVEATRWRSLRAVLTDGVVLLDKPEGLVAQQNGAPKDIPLGVLQSRGAWLEVETLVDLSQRSRGWVRRADTTPWSAKP